MPPCQRGTQRKGATGQTTKIHENGSAEITFQAESKSTSVIDEMSSLLMLSCTFVVAPALIPEADAVRPTQELPILSTHRAQLNLQAPSASSDARIEGT